MAAVPSGLQLNSPLQDALWTLAEEGADEVAGPGPRARGPWAGLLRDGHELTRRLREDFAGEVDQALAVVDAGDWETLDQAAGVIVLRDENGEFGARIYQTEEDLASAWATILVELEPEETGIPGGPESRSRRQPHLTLSSAEDAV